MIAKSRRTFLKSTAMAGVALSVGSLRVLGANNDIRVAVIGLGNKGSGHLNKFSNAKGVRVVAACDVDPERLESRTKNKVPKLFATTDPRKVLDRDDVDVVVIATPDHWHALLAVWACQAGKDVYVEKPVSHNIWEGRQIVKAAAKYGRIVQAGTQYRSCTGLRAAAEYIHQGNLGKVWWGHVPWYERRGSIGLKAPYMPDGLDYDLYCGPGPLKPLRRNKLHYDWHWVWSTGTGDLGNSGIHAFDICRWFAGYEGLPSRALCVGGRFAVNDAGETPNTQMTILDYGAAPIIIENRNLSMKKGTDAMDNIRGIREGVILQCEHGFFAGFKGGGWIYDNDGKKVKRFPGDGGATHHTNFLEAVRNRTPESLNAHIEKGHISSATCHLGNVSYRLGVSSNMKTILETIGDGKLAGETVARIEKHLAANKIDLQKTPVRFGPWLSIDAQTEVITQYDDSHNADAIAKANNLVQGKYREPFVFPETV